MSARGDRTREHLLDVTEQLFAERGVNRVSLREVRIASGARNTAAIQFHFGDRDGLLKALTDRHMPKLAEIQEHLYEQVLASDDPENARSLVEVLVRPACDYLMLGTSERMWVQIMGNLAALPDLHVKEMISVTPEAGKQAATVLRRQLRRNLPAAVVQERMLIVQQASLHLSADRARLLDDPATGRTLSTQGKFTGNLVDMLTAALFAPIGELPAPRPKTARRAKANTGSRPGRRS
jgi:AcrR family transcriptional regulator